MLSNRFSVAIFAAFVGHVDGRGRSHNVESSAATDMLRCVDRTYGPGRPSIDLITVRHPQVKAVVAGRARTDGVGVLRSYSKTDAILKLYEETPARARYPRTRRNG